MSDNSLTTQNDGTTIDAEDVNQYKTALSQDHVPRNSSGIATDQAGSLGTAVLRWLNAYIQKIFIGAIAKGLAITQDGDDLSFEVGGSEVFKLTANGLERIQLPAVGQQISSGSGTFSTSSTTLVDVTNLSITITTTGRPRLLALIPDGNNTVGQDGTIQALDNSSSNAAARLAFLRASTIIAQYEISTNTTVAGVSAESVGVPPGSILFLDPVGAGTYTYKLQGKVASGDALAVRYCKLVAYEL